MDGIVIEHQIQDASVAVLERLKMGAVGENQ